MYYVTMQITFLTRKFRNWERNLHCDVVHITTKWVSSLTLDCNGVFAIKDYCCVIAAGVLARFSCRNSWNLRLRLTERDNNRPANTMHVLRPIFSMLSWHSSIATSVMRSSSQSKQCNVPEKYVKLIQDIVLRLSNQGARLAGGKSNIIQRGCGVAPRFCLESIPVPHTQTGEEITTRIRDVCGRHCRATLWRHRSRPKHD